MTLFLMLALGCITTGVAAACGLFYWMHTLCDMPPIPATAIATVAGIVVLCLLFEKASDEA